MALIGHSGTRDRAYGCFGGGTPGAAAMVAPSLASTSSHSSFTGPGGRFTCRSLLCALTTHIPLSLLLVFSLLVKGGGAIDCFKCVSVDGSHPPCDDPFHNNYTSDILESPCMGGRKGRNGLFPATACIKLAGIYDDSGERLTVRGCALDSGTLTTDTEIIRMSHCGGFYFDRRYVRGCLQSCDDADACNHAPTTNFHLQNIVASVIVATFSSTFIFYHCGFR